MQKKKLRYKQWANTTSHTVLAGATSGLIGFCVFGTGVSLFQKGFGSDAAAWTQAAGSIAAILGAVWILGAQERHQRRQKRLEREEAAWSVRFSIALARDEAYTVVHELFNPNLTVGSEKGRHWKTRCRNARLLLQSYANRSDHIHPAVVQEANNAILLIEELEADLQQAAPHLIEGSVLPLTIAETLA
ncbi:MAG: hypothetical protein JO105_02925 [Hyphomicrobiales bacterium]|nr:hypothetical protein [Hyphomicrobiales bacterium]